LLTDIIAKKALDDDLKARMKTAIEACKKKFVHDAKGNGAGAEEPKGGAEPAVKKKAK
jgi:hypothetical protein